MKHQWNGFVAIVVSELRGRWAVFGTLAILGLLAYLSPLLMDGLNVSSTTEVREVTALIFSLLVTLGGALLLGGQMVVYPLSEGRLAFFLARPLSGWTLWWGQITSAMLTLFLGWWLVWLPTLLAGGTPWKLTDRGTVLNGAIQLPSTVPWSLPEPFSVIPVWSPVLPEWLNPVAGSIGLAWTLASLLCLLVGHWLYLVLRLRTRWAALDLILLVGSVLVLIRLLMDFYQRMAFREHLFSLWGLLVTFLAVALWAGGRQMVLGGTDATRSHGAFSVALWPWILVMLGVLFVVHLWMVSRGPEDLKTLENLHASPDGQWLVVSGKPWRGGSYEPVYLVHGESGESQYLGPRFALPGFPIFSAQSKAVVWVRCPMTSQDCVLHWQELGGQERSASMAIEREYRQLYSNYRNRTVAVNDDGFRVAMAHQSRLEVYALPELRLLATQRLGNHSNAHLNFEGNDELWVYHQIMRPGDLYVDFWRLGLEDSDWSYMGASAGHFRALHAEADRLLLSQFPGRLVLLDRLGKQEHGRHMESTRPLMSSRLLTTGQVVTVESDSEQVFSLCVYGTDGRQIFSETFEEGFHPLLGGEIEAGRLLVGRRFGRPTASPPSDAQAWLPGFGAVADWQTQVFDASEGWVGDPWPGVLPAWQVGHSFEQGRWLLSTQGVQRLEDVTEGQFSTRLPLAY